APAGFRRGHHYTSASCTGYQDGHQREASDVMTADLLGQPYTLAQLLPEQALGAAASLALSGLCLDSRKLAAGEVFIALPGTKVDGRQFIDQAIAAGASAVLVDADTPQV